MRLRPVLPLTAAGLVVALALVALPAPRVAPVVDGITQTIGKLTERPPVVEPPVVQAAEPAIAAPAPPPPPVTRPAPVAPTPTPQPAYSKRTALIIGINNAKGGRPLPGSVADAQNLQTALDLYGFEAENVTVLLEEEASREAILSHLDELALRTPEDGLAVFAIATHTRRRLGTNELLTADGKRISAHELASRLAAVRAPMWIALPTCYAGGYKLPGIVGPGRLAVFASEAHREAYQVGSAGSYLFLEMVRNAMIEGHAPDSVQQAFYYAKQRLKEWAPSRVPTMSDGIGHELVLGEWSGIRPPPSAESVEAQEEPRPAPPGTVRSAPSRATPSPSPTPTPSSGKDRRGTRVCGPLKVNCSR